MKRLALMMILILTGIIIYTAEKKQVMPDPYREEGEDDIIGQEALKHL